MPDHARRVQQYGKLRGEVLDDQTARSLCVFTNNAPGYELRWCASRNTPANSRRAVGSGRIPHIFCARTDVANSQSNYLAWTARTMTKQLNREVGHRTSRASLLTADLNRAIQHVGIWDLQDAVREALWDTVYTLSCRATDTLHFVFWRGFR